MEDGALQAAVAPRNLRRALAHSPGLAAAMQNFGQQLLLKSKLQPRLREIAILRTAALTECAYEWTMHVALFAQKCGLSAAHLLDLEGEEPGDTDLWSEPEILAIAIAGEMHRFASLEDETWLRARNTWTAQELVELIITCGHYRGLAGFLNAARTPVDEGAAALAAAAPKNV